MVAAAVLAGCSSAASSEGTSAEAATDATSATDAAPATDGAPDAEAAPDAGPIDAHVQQETCDWDADRISGPNAPPGSQDGDLAQTLVGAWQHTHTDEGAGFEPVTNDYRYVFPSSDRLLYCQHVPGVTDFAENSGDITLHDTTIELPGGVYSYTVIAWSDDAMIWDNPAGGGSVYLLQRR